MIEKEAKEAAESFRRCIHLSQTLFSSMGDFIYRTARPDMRKTWKPLTTTQTTALARAALAGKFDTQLISILVINVMAGEPVEKAIASLPKTYFKEKETEQ